MEAKNNKYSDNSPSSWTVFLTLISIAALIISIFVLISVSNKTNDKSQSGNVTQQQLTTTTPEIDDKTKTQTNSPPVTTCKDVTSYDYNWNNDVVCTKPDGTQFYTNYAGAKQYGYDF